MYAGRLRKGRVCMTGLCRAGRIETPNTWTRFSGACKGRISQRAGVPRTGMHKTDRCVWSWHTARTREGQPTLDEQICECHAWRKPKDRMLKGIAMVLSCVKIDDKRVKERTHISYYGTAHSTTHLTKPHTSHHTHRTTHTSHHAYHTTPHDTTHHRHRYEI